jgi:uncharacterized membrane protein YkoI
MKKHIGYMAVLALGMSVLSVSAVAAKQTPLAKSDTAITHFKGDELAKNAKISRKQARVIALKTVPGKITDEELETEQGGSGLRYSFVIQQGSKMREVGVDAKTGKVLENSKEGSL